ncbi:MAG: glycosyltransferase family 2 protein, partial [Actinomycetota bacterium]
AETAVLDPWPGTTAALAELARRSEQKRGAMPVTILRAGTILRRATLARAAEALAGGDGVVVPVKSTAASIAIRARSRRHATFQPGSGAIVGARLFARLLAQGWLAGEPVTVGDIRRDGARIHPLRRALARPSTQPARERPTVTVLIPAHNEAAFVGDTLRALDAQTIAPDQVIVVDDASDDGTGDIARALGARVIRPPAPRGSKAAATTYGMPFVRTEAVMVLDADTQLHHEALEHLSDDLRHGLDATSGACLPVIQQGIWPRGRAIEYSMAIRIHKPVQRALGTLVVLSGCISMFRTSALRAIGGFQERTLAEDIDATWEYQVSGGKAGYAPQAMSFPVEPATWRLYRAQMRRWASGFYQSIGIHGFRLRKTPGLALIILTSLWDVFTVPLLAGAMVYAAITRQLPAQFLAMFGLFLLLPLVSAGTVIGWRSTVKNFPAYLVTLWANSYFYVEALFVEWIVRRRRVAWVKGH